MRPGRSLLGSRKGGGDQSLVTLVLFAPGKGLSAPRMMLERRRPFGPRINLHNQKGRSIRHQHTCRPKTPGLRQHNIWVQIEIGRCPTGSDPAAITWASGSVPSPSTLWRRKPAVPDQDCNAPPQKTDNLSPRDASGPGGHGRNNPMPNRSYQALNARGFPSRSTRNGPGVRSKNPR